MAIGYLTGSSVVSVNAETGVVVLDAADVGADVAGAAAAVEDLLDAINASQITAGTLDYRRLGGVIAEALTVAFGRATLAVPGTAADMWQWQYNGTRVTYINEYSCLRVRGIDQTQTPARFMSHANRDGTTLPTFQVSSSDALTHLFQVLANGDILAPGALSMLPSAPLAVTYTGLMGNAATITDGAAGSGAPYAATTTYVPSDNRVWLDGAMANNGGVTINAQTSLFVIGAAHRPASWAQFPGRTSTNLAVRLTVKGSTGVVCADQAMAAGATLSFDGANFRKA